MLFELVGGSNHPGDGLVRDVEIFRDHAHRQAALVVSELREGLPAVLWVRSLVGGQIYEM